MELIIAAGLMALVSAGVATGIYQLTSRQNELSQKFDGGEFVANLARSMTERSTCQSYMQSHRVPTTQNFENLQISNYVGFADASGGPLRPGYIISGTADNPQMSIRELSWRLKEAVSQPFPINGVSHFKATVQMKIGLQAWRQGAAHNMPDRYLEYSVVARSADRSITDCEGEPKIEDSCSVLGTNYSSADGTCEVSDQTCVITGSYIKSTCSPVGPPCRAEMQAPSKVNEVTGRYNCPSGSEPFASFVHSWVSEEKTGKKSFTNVTNSIESYMCMQCPPKK